MPTAVCSLRRLDVDRDRLLDMERRLRPLRAGAFGVLAGALVAGGPWVGWWTLVPLGLAAAGFAVVDHGLQAAERPELRIAGAWLIAETAIAVSVALTGGARSPAVAWLAIPVVTLSARFNARGVACGVLVVAALMLASTLGVSPNVVAQDPPVLLFPLALLGAVALLSMALMKSDLDHRSASIIDPLTSMLNRNALRTRIDELTQQAAILGEPVGMIVGDLDRFKAINDGHGHAVGDAVLRDVAYRMRKHLRAFDLAYRLGGEEFLVLLPGAELAQTVAVAEQLRGQVSAQPCAGQRVTMSFGASASTRGVFAYDDVFAHADQALYRAKRAGRNRVETADTAQAASTVAA